MLDKYHPYFYIKDFAKAQNLILSFGKYKYIPDSILDERIVFQECIKNIDEHYLTGVISGLGENEELAMHSVVVGADGPLKRKHIPMIDFCVPEWSLEISERLRYFLPEKIYKELIVFKSGRSFHGYSLCMISYREWLDFMGRLLLINPPGVNYIDTRWIGHRVIAGYSSLRWSARTKNYIGMPKFWGHIQQISQF